MSRSDELYTEIIEVVNVFHEPLLYFLQEYIKIVYSQQGDANVLKTIVIMLKIFYKFIYQDIHPKIEDNLGNWVGLLKRILDP